MNFIRGSRLLAIAIVCALTACSRSQPPPNVVLISIDSLRGDHVGHLGYPQPTTPTIDRLAEQGSVFTQAISPTCWTLPAHTSLFTGLPIAAHGVRHPANKLSSSLETLAGRLKGAGYQTTGFYAGPFVHPDFGMDSGFDRYLDCTAYGLGDEGRIPGSQVMALASHSDITGPLTIRRFSEELKNRDRTKPFFYFAHLWDVHYDYIPPEPYDSMFDPDYAGEMTGSDFLHNESFRVGMNEADFRHIVALYDGEVRWTDATVEALMGALRDEGVADDTLVVITADHGEEFLDHGRKGHRVTLYEEMLRVPLVFWLPGRVRAQRIDKPVGLVDVAPTILELAGAGPFKHEFGYSLAGLLDGTRSVDDMARPPVLAEFHHENEPTPELAALRGDRWKALWMEPLGRGNYYELAIDPAESRPIDPKIYPDAADYLEELQERLKVAQDWHVAHVTAEPSTPTEKTTEQLRALGYLN